MNSFAEVSTSWIAENNSVSSGNKFALYDGHQLQSFTKYLRLTLVFM